MDKDSLTRKQAILYITEALDGLTPDIIQLIYRIVLHVESGLE